MTRKLVLFLFGALFLAALSAGTFAVADKPKTKAPKTQSQKNAQEIKALRRQVATLLKVVMQPRRRSHSGESRLASLLLPIKKQICNNRTGGWDQVTGKCLPALRLSSHKFSHTNIHGKATCGRGWHVAGTHEAIARYYLDPASRRRLKFTGWVWTIGNGGHYLHLNDPLRGSALGYVHHSKTSYTAAACQPGTWPAVHFSGMLANGYKPRAHCFDKKEVKFVLCARDVK